MKEYIKQNYLYYLLWLAFSAVTCLLVFPLLDTDFINYDSSYQYFLTQHSFEDMLRLLPEDYSPPFYAVTLKLFTMVFGNSLSVMRVFNLIAVCGMLFFAAFPVRRMFGVRTAVICSIIMTISAINIDQLPEIRPTLFSMFYFTAVSVFGYSALFEGKRSAYVGLTAFSVIAMYTHNVAMLGTLGIYITLLVFALLMKEYSRLRNIFICGVICAVAYIPWLRVVLYQFGNVQEDFWSSSTPSMKELFTWTFTSPFEYYVNTLMHSILLIGAAVTLIAVLIRNVRFNKIRGMQKLSDIMAVPLERPTLIKAAYLLCSYIMAIALMYLFSVLVYPLATPRYFHIFTGYLIIILAAGLANSRLRIMHWFFIALCAANFCGELMRINDISTREELNYGTSLPETLGSDAVFLHYHEWSLGTMCYYFPDSVHYVCDDTYTVLQTFDVFTPEIVDVGDASSIAEYTDEFYVLISGDMDKYMHTDAAELLENSFPDAELHDIGAYHIPETFLAGFQVYRVELR